MGTLLYVHGNPTGYGSEDSSCMFISDLTEQYIKAEISFEDVLYIVKTKKIIERKIFVLYINICAPYVRGFYDNFITKRGSAW